LKGKKINTPDAIIVIPRMAYHTNGETNPFLDGGLK
jgi:hypothetical protein